MAKNLVLWLVIATVLFMVFKNFNEPAVQQEMAYSDFVTEVRAGNVREVVFEGNIIRGVGYNNQPFRVVMLPTIDLDLRSELVENGVAFKAEKKKRLGSLRTCYWQPCLYCCLSLCSYSLCAKCKVAAVVAAGL